MRYGEISPFYCIEELVANPVLDGVSVPAGTSGQKEHCLGISKLSFNSTSFCSEQELHFQIFPTTILHWLYALQSNCHCQFKNTFRLNSSYQWCQLILYIYMDPELRTEQTTNEIKQTQKHRETSWNTVKHCETLWNIVNIRKTPRLNLSAKETCDFLHPAHTLLDLRSSFDLFCLHVSGTNTIKMYAESCRTLNLVESHISNKRPNAFVSRRSPNDDHRPAAHSLAARVPHVFHPKLRCWSLHFTSCHFMSLHVQKTQQLCNSATPSPLISARFDTSMLLPFVSWSTPP